MVHLAISLAACCPRLSFRVIQIGEHPQWAESEGVLATPSLVIPGQPPHAGNLPPAHVAYYLWQAGTTSS